MFTEAQLITLSTFDNVHFVSLPMFYYNVNRNRPSYADDPVTDFIVNLPVANFMVKDFNGLLKKIIDGEIFCFLDSAKTQWVVNVNDKGETFYNVRYAEVSRNWKLTQVPKSKEELGATSYTDPSNSIELLGGTLLFRPDRVNY